MISTSGRSPTRVARGGVLVLGGGFAGAHVARRLGRSGVTVVNPDNFVLSRPLLPGVATGRVEPRRAALPLRNLCPHADLVIGSVTDVDVRRRTARVHTEAEPCTIAYADLVVALGSAQPTPTTPGLAEHAFGLHDLRAAVALRDHVLRQVELADSDPGPANERLTFVVAGSPRAALDTVTALRRHPRLRGTSARWLVLGEGGGTDRALHDRGVEIVSGATLRSVTPAGLELADGHRIATRTVVWCPPTTAHPLLAQMGLPLDAGRLEVDETLRVAPRVWALGDCAALPGYPSSSRQVRDQARVVAANLRHPPRRYRARPGRLGIVPDRIATALFAELFRSNGGNNDANP